MPSAPVCVHCRQRPAQPRWRPFCSERCKMADLGRWLAGEYRVPVASTGEAPEDGEDRDDASS